MVFFILNPITWAIVVAVSIWTKQYWKPALAGVLTPLACIALFFVYFIFMEVEISFDEMWNDLHDAGIGFDDLWNEFVDEGIEILLSVLSASILSGIIISALVFLFVRERRQQRAASANA
jgi:hypothetical protein